MSDGIIIKSSTPTKNTQKINSIQKKTSHSKTKHLPLDNSNKSTKKRLSAFDEGIKEEFEGEDCNDFENNIQREKLDFENLTPDPEEQIGYDILGEQYIIDDDDELEVNEENMENFQNKVKASGVVYISFIPEGMNIHFIRKAFEEYGVSRIYLLPSI